MLQDHLDLRAAREEHSAREHRAPAAGADGITRSRLDSGHRRLLATLAVFTSAVTLATFIAKSAMDELVVS